MSKTSDDLYYYLVGTPQIEFWDKWIRPTYIILTREKQLGKYTPEESFEKFKFAIWEAVMEDPETFSWVGEHYKSVQQAKNDILALAQELVGKFEEDYENRTHDFMQGYDPKVHEFVSLNKSMSKLSEIKNILTKVALRNEDVIRMFLTDDFPHSSEEGKERGIKRWQPSYGTPNLQLRQEGGNWTLTNYSTPLLVRDSSGQVWFNEQKYSVTTSTIQNKVKRMAQELGVQLKPFKYNVSSPSPFEYSDDAGNQTQDIKAIKKVLRKLCGWGDEERQTDELIRLCGGVQKADRLQQIWNNSSNNEGEFRQQALKEGFKPQAINFFLNLG